MYIQELWTTCLRLDWCGKDEKQAQNAQRLIDRLGPDTDPATIDTAQIDRLVAWLRRAGPTGKGCSNSTIRRYLSALRVMLKRAERMGLIDRLPLMPETRTLKEPEPRELVIKDEWFEALLIGLEDCEMRSLMKFLLATGCRVGEALDLTWDRVGHDRVQFVRTKGNRARALPMVKAIREALPGEALPQDGRVFSMSYQQVRYAFDKAKRRACDLLGLDMVTRKEWTIHSLRHTALTRLAGQGMSATQLQQWAGHSSLSVTQRYIHVGLSELTEWCKAKDSYSPIS